MEESIVRYFSEHRDCPLPGLGSLGSRETHAVLDPADNKIIAPSAIVIFSHHELNTDLLLAQICNDQQCEHHEASIHLNQFVSKINELEIDKSFSLGALGDIRKTDTDQFEIVAFAHSSIHGEDIVAHKVLRNNSSHHILVGDKETTKEAMQEFYEEEDRAATTRWWIAASIFLVISAALILLHYFYFAGNNRFGNHMNF